MRIAIFLPRRMMYRAIGIPPIQMENHLQSCPKGNSPVRISMNRRIFFRSMPVRRLDYAVLPKQRHQVGLGARADMADHLGRGDAAHPPAGFQIVALGQPPQEGARKQIARAGGIDDLVGTAGTCQRWPPRQDMRAMFAFGAGQDLDSRPPPPPAPRRNRRSGTSTESRPGWRTADRHGPWIIARNASRCRSMQNGSDSVSDTRPPAPRPAAIALANASWLSGPSNR